MQRAFILGPTASDKTRVALELAPLIDAEIISLDSMLVYRGMDLGTAKPSKKELGLVKHHMIDVVDPLEDFSVAKYVDACKEIEQDLSNRGKSALYVGGTTMWFKALVFGLIDMPDIPSELRESLSRRLKEEGAMRLRCELQSIDAVSYDRIHPNDDRRLLRALETWHVTGKPLSYWQKQWHEDNNLNELAWVLHWPRSILHKRVAERFSLMIEQGLLEEIKNILLKGGFGKTASKAIGYKQMLQYLKGDFDLETALSKSVSQTNVLIRRQMTWYRSFDNLRFVDMEDNVSVEYLATKLASEFTSYYEGA